MSYRKLKADYLFDGKLLETGRRVLICQTDGTIEKIVDESEAGNDIELYSGILSPGFVNCHCHLELSHLKGKITEKTGLVDFVLQVMANRLDDIATKQKAITESEQQMKLSGTVAIGDICNGADTIPSKLATTLFYYNFIEVLGWAPQLAQSRFADAQKLERQFQELPVGRNKVSLNPHAPYSVSEGLWKAIGHGFNQKTITIHNQESNAENEFFRYGRGDLLRMYSTLKMDVSHFQPTGESSLSHYLRKLKMAARILLVHNTFTDLEDLQALAEEKNRVFFCFCPNANLFIEDRLPEIPLFIRNGFRIVIGTDSLASNYQLDLIEELKTIRKFFPEVMTAQMLPWITSSGAEALGFSDSLGDFETGKKPGVVLIENCPEGEIGENSRSRRIL